MWELDVGGWSGKANPGLWKQMLWKDREQKNEWISLAAGQNPSRTSGAYAEAYVGVPKRRLGVTGFDWLINNGARLRSVIMQFIHSSSVSVSEMVWEREAVFTLPKQEPLSWYGEGWHLCHRYNKIKWWLMSWCIFDRRTSSSSFIVRFPSYAQVGRFPPTKLLQLILSNAHSFFSPKTLSL